MTAHAILGASSSKRWMNCPGSIALQEQFPPQTSSTFAEEGSAAHALCEFILLNPNGKPEDWKGWYINKAGDMFKAGDDAKTDDAYEINDQMIDGVNLYVETVMGYVEDLAALSDGSVKPSLEVEKSFDLSFIQPEMFGTNDACVFLPGHTLVVADFKYGRGITVEPDNNSQLMYYGLGALRKLCWNDELEMYDPALLPETVELVIIQPRAPHEKGPVRTWQTSSLNLLENFAEELLAAALATREEDAELKAGSWCTFCRAKSGCPAIRGEVMTALSTDFDDIGDDEDMEQVVKDNVAQICASPELLSKALKSLPLIDIFVKGVTAHATAEMTAGRSVPDFKLVRKNSRRRWASEERAAEELELVYEEDEIYEPRKLKSFTKIEKLEGAKGIVSNLVEKPEGSLTIASVEDPRPAVDMDPGQSFLELDDDE